MSTKMMKAHANPIVPSKVILTSSVFTPVKRIRNRGFYMDGVNRRYQLDPNFTHLRYQTKFVGGEGSLKPQIMFVGESPSHEDEMVQKVFSGPMGRVFDDMLRSVDLKREHVWCTYLVKYRTPGGRDPRPDELRLATSYLGEEINALAPKIIVPLGRVPLSVMIPNATIGNVHGQIIVAGLSRVVIPMMSLVAVTLNPTLRAAQFDDMMKIAGLLQ